MVWSQIITFSCVSDSSSHEQEFPSRPESETWEWLKLMKKEEEEEEEESKSARGRGRLAGWGY